MAETEHQAATDPTAPVDLGDLKLGVDTRTVQLSGLEDNRAATAALCAQATRIVRIASRLLDARVLDTVEVWDGLRGCISRQPRFQVRLLVFDPEGLVRAGHALLRLSQDFSSFVDLRVPAEIYREYDAFLLLVDEAGVLHRPVAERWHGIASFNDSSRVRLLGNEFDKMWETASKDVNLARMRL